MANRTDRTKTVEQRMAPLRRSPDACWIWTKARTKAGYGHFRQGGVDTYAHRAAYELAHGPIDPKLHLDHTCGQKACCNPAHLVPRTQGEHNRRHARDKTKCCRGHSLTAPGALRVRADGGQECRLCREGWNAVRWFPERAAAYRVSKKRE